MESLRSGVRLRSRPENGHETGRTQSTPRGGRGDQTGQYIADTQLDMAGTWRLTLEWKGPAGSGAASFSGNVQ
jgi:hypothetical protein